MWLLFPHQNFRGPRKRAFVFVGVSSRILLACGCSSSEHHFSGRPGLHLRPTYEKRDARPVDLTLDQARACVPDDTEAFQQGFASLNRSGGTPGAFL